MVLNITASEGLDGVFALNYGKINSVTIRKNPDLDKIALQRAMIFNDLPFEEKWNRLIKIILLSSKMTNKFSRKPNKITLTKEGTIYNR